MRMMAAGSHFCTRHQQLGVSHKENTNMKLLTAVLTFGLVASVASVAAAQSASPVTEQGMPAAAIEPATTVQSNKVLKKTYRVEDSGTQAVGGGFVAVHAPVTINCPGTAGVCFVEAHQNMQVIGDGGSGRWAICTAIDGNFMSQPLCPYLDIVPNGFYHARNFVQTQTGISFGNHTIQTFIYTDGPATRSIFELTYRVYKP